MKKSFLILKSGSQRYGLSAEFACYVEESGRDFVALPGVRGPLLGLMVTRGEVVPVLSFNRLLGSDDKVDENGRYVVVDVKGRLLALQVEAVRQFRVFEPKEVYEPTLEFLRRGSLRMAGVAEDEEPLLLIDGHSILEFEGETT